jgi:uncharacterized protein (TIGR02466 family)
MKQIIDLFPLPLGVVECPLDIKEIIKFFDTVSMESEQGSVYGLVSENTYVLDNPICKPLADWILKSMQKYSEEILGWDEKLQFSQTWLTYKLPGQRHEVHTHPNSLLAGVFYYETYDNYPAIEFHTPVVSFGRSTLQPKLKYPNNSKYLRESISFTPQLNDLIIFPSNIPHSVPVNNTKQIRKALGINTLPVKTIGDRRSLNELDYSRFI